MVQVKNIAGVSIWINMGDFILLSAPVELVLNIHAINEITLSWEDKF